MSYTKEEQELAFSYTIPTKILTIVHMMKIIDIASERGAFRPQEMSHIGNTYDKLLKGLNWALEKARAEGQKIQHHQQHPNSQSHLLSQQHRQIIQEQSLTHPQLLHLRQNEMEQPHPSQPQSKKIAKEELFILEQEKRNQQINMDYINRSSEQRQDAPPILLSPKITDDEVQKQIEERKNFDQHFFDIE